MVHNSMDEDKQFKTSEPYVNWAECLIIKVVSNGLHLETHSNV